MLETRHEGRGHPVTVRRFGDELLAFMAPAMAACHRRICAGFINKNKPCEVKISLRSLPKLASQGDIRPILLRRINRFF